MTMQEELPRIEFVGMRVEISMLRAGEESTTRLSMERTADGWTFHFHGPSPLGETCPDIDLDGFNRGEPCALLFNWLTVFANTEFEGVVNRAD